MNMIKGKLDPANPQVFVASDGTRLSLPKPFAQAVGRNLVYGLRPEYIQLGGDSLKVEVVVTEPTGYETQIIANFGGGEITCIFRERIDAQPGEAIRITIDPAHVHLFDEETGMRLVG